MSDFRRAGLWFTAFVVIVFAGDRLLSNLLERILLRSQFRFSSVYRGGNDAEILIIGDSRGLNSFYPPAIERLTGKRAFNLSFNSMPPRIAEAVLMDYLDRNQPPRVVIIEATSVVCNMKLASQLRTYANVSPRLRALYQESHPTAAAAGRFFRLLPYNSEFFLRALLYFRRSDQDWIMRRRLTPEQAARAHGRRSLHPWPENLDALARMVATLRQRGIRVRLVVAPYLYHHLMTNETQLIAAVMSRVEKVAPEQRILNYVGAVQGPANFADGVHMNQTGSEAFMGILYRDGVLSP